MGICIIVSKFCVAQYEFAEIFYSNLISPFNITRLKLVDFRPSAVLLSLSSSILFAKTDYDESLTRYQ